MKNRRASVRKQAIDLQPGTPRLVSWALYDWANQAYGTLIHTFVFSVYFIRSVAADETTGTVQWGTTISIAGFVVAVAAPILGAVADQGGRRKPWIVGFTLLCVSTCALLWFVKPSPQFVWLALIPMALATIGSELSIVFYNSLLPRLVRPDRIGRWSGWSWGLGYAGGLASMIAAFLVLIWPQGAWLGLDSDRSEHVRAVALLVAGWYLAFALPFILLTPDVPDSGKPLRRMVRDGLDQLRATGRGVRSYAPIVRFLVAHMLYIDGLATLFVFGGIYAAATFGMSQETVLVFGIMLNFAAGIGAFGFAWIDDRIGSRATILLSLTALVTSGSLILIVHSTVLFWTIGAVLGVFVGPAQAAGRSFLARIAPEGLQGEMFGLLALSGKATAFVGPALVGWVTYLTGSQRLGMATIVVFFAIGLIIMLTVPADSASRQDAAPGNRQT
ncbi:MFS transporter [Sinorhizobium numidicum]|uniref:MFS transporter n=1 Tax=Sinorhizobium numidicum TaxID=680248 RepID=A0ABY8CNN5_9HYPH|nr:MFS transporter [Sinorhizobium numidicum]WEX74293.1 MFS transporter [Sinorhizobium numidicum]WEX80279.1 MFS transporter [Sinorhizobium numidicum]